MDPASETGLIAVALTGPPAAPVSRAEFLHAACLVGHRLEQCWARVPLGVDLYGGIAGVALFLARLASVSRDARDEAAAAIAAASFVRQLEAVRVWLSAGAFAGCGGAIYALTHLGVLLREGALLDRAASLIPPLLAVIPADRHFDVMSGSAGAIMALAALHAVVPSPDTLNAIRAAANHLMERAPPAACGAAGIALSLLTAAALTGEPRYESAARTVMSDERAHCGPAPGIGLARLAGLRHADDASVREEIARAVHATQRHGFGRNHSLCDGDLGSLELLTGAAARLGEPGLASSAACFAAGILRSIRQHGWKCGGPRKVEVPGLMVGLAGIGDGLLRVAEPRLTSLLLQPP